MVGLSDGVVDSDVVAARGGVGRGGEVVRRVGEGV